MYEELYNDEFSQGKKAEVERRVYVVVGVERSHRIESSRRERADWYPDCEKQSLLKTGSSFSLSLFGLLTLCSLFSAHCLSV